MFVTFRLCLCILLTFTLAGSLNSQVKPKVSLIGGDNVPQLKQRIETTLEAILLEMNRISKGAGDTLALRTLFNTESYQTFEHFVLQNRAYTARKSYSPQMIERQHGEFYDIRAITVKVNLGETETSDNQNLIFTFSRTGLITSVRSMLPNYDFQSVVSNGISEKDSIMRGVILDFMERFRMAYNTKDQQFLEKVYSDDALILVGTVLQEKKNSENMMNKSFLSATKVKLIQQTKREYLDGLKEKAFKKNSFVNVRFEDFKILQHEKIPFLYGVSCWQQWNSSNYSDKGHLFLMMDFRKPDEPIIHVRAWQPKPFEEDNSYVTLYDFDVVEYR